MSTGRDSTDESFIHFPGEPLGRNLAGDIIPNPFVVTDEPEEEDTEEIPAEEEEEEVPEETPAEETPVVEETPEEVPAETPVVEEAVPEEPVQ